MEFSGDEKRIQALFSELSLENQTRTPRFEKLWQVAEANAPARTPLAMRFVLVAIVIVVVMSFVAARSWSQIENMANIPLQIIPTTSAPRIQQPEQQLLSAAAKDVVRPRRVIRRPTARAAIRQAELLSNWQSPTSSLLNSPAVSVLSSLPQLNQSAKDLEQFLPKNNEVIKESKQ